MRVVLLGDSHLARVRRDLAVVGPDVFNAARGGASSPDLLGQAAVADVSDQDLVVVSVGTNDAAPWKQVPLTTFLDSVRECISSVPARRWVYVAPPGVDEGRLVGAGQRTNDVIDGYRNAAIDLFEDEGARIVRTDRVIGPLGSRAFADDGLHLSGQGYEVVLPAIAAVVGAGV